MIHQGWLNISKYSKKNEPRNIWAILYDDRIALHKDETKAIIIREYYLNGLVIANDLRRMSFSITALNEKIELSSENAEDFTDWKNAFSKALKIAEENHVSGSESPRSHYSNALSTNEHTDSASEIDIIYEMFDSYNTIMKKTFR